jgi:steroid 5-alpha reductase family enzyme
MSNWALVGTFLAVSSLVMAIGWAVYAKTQEASFVDVVWTIGTAIGGILFLIENQGNLNRTLLLGGMIVLWSTRLSTHLILRLRKRGEDRRYQRMKAFWGEKAQVKFFWFFQAQAVFMTLFSLPFLAVGNNPSPLGQLDTIAALIWLTGFIGGTLADFQLEQFKSNPNTNRDEVFRRGLWRYSRHPNYFCEWLLWSSYVVFGIRSEGGVWLISIPIVLYLIITKLTGSSHIERAKLKASNKAYTDYIATTNPFFPWPPKPRAKTT